MDELDLSTRELSKQLGVSSDHARRLQEGQTLPSQLLVEKTAVATGISVQELQLAVQRDRICKSVGSRVGAANFRKISLFEPLIDALDPDQIPAAYAMLEKMVNSKRPIAKSGTIRPRKEALDHRLPPDKKQKKKVSSAASFRGRTKK